MQMSENNRFFSFALDSAHVKFDVLNGPKLGCVSNGQLIMLTLGNFATHKLVWRENGSDLLSMIDDS